MSDNHISAVAYFREQQALQEEAAQQGLSGYAITARHAFITRRMEQGGKRILQLIEEGKIEEAHALWDTDTWGVEEPDENEWQTEKQPETAEQSEIDGQALQEHRGSQVEERKEHEQAEPAH